MRQSIFERYGGFATIRRVVSAFYERVLDSPQLSPYFERVPMPRLIDHQTRFVASVMGGPDSYSDEHLRRVHAHMNISTADFEAMIAAMRETLEDLDFQAPDVATVIAELRAREPVIVAHH
jgi:hemoglobin